jgi:hypothetical protein
LTDEGGDEGVVLKANVGGDMVEYFFLKQMYLYIITPSYESQAKYPDRTVYHPYVNS